MQPLGGLAFVGLMADDAMTVCRDTPSTSAISACANVNDP
jgi:hypothetical protein